MCADADVICCETVINPLEMFPYMTSAATTGADDDDEIKFLFTIRYMHTLMQSRPNVTWHAGALRRDATQASRCQYLQKSPSDSASS